MAICPVGRCTLWLGVAILGSVLAGGCPPVATPGTAPLSAALTPMVLIPAGPFPMGSTPEEREYGYRLDEILHQSTTARQYSWFENETRHEAWLPAYTIDRLLVTNADYAPFVVTGHRAPFVTEAEWQTYGLIHPYTTVVRFLWHNGQPPRGRAQHPVVLVSHTDAMAYCTWRGQREGRPLRLPSEAEWEKAARGTDGRYFPWGNTFDASRLNSMDGGPYDTVPVGQYPEGQSPYGVLDMAGQVFEWTATPAQFDPPRFIIKGGSWDDLPGVTRAAARHARPAELKHILIGFRCVTSAAD